MRVLIATQGSHGDVLPFIALGREFHRRGHDVVLYANPYFERHVTDAQLHFRPVSTLTAYNSLFGGSADATPRRAFERVAEHFASTSGDYYRALESDVIPRQTIAVGSSLMFAHRLLRETKGVQCATVHLAPSVFRSDERPARLVPRWIQGTTPTIFKQLVWWALDQVFYEPKFTRPLNALRNHLGLPPVTRIFRSWLHDADCVVGLFPDWFAQRPSDWPTHVELTNFPLYDHGDLVPLHKSLWAFLEAGPPPVAFSAGTATSTAHAFFAASATACHLAGLRGILLSPFSNQMPAHLPPGVEHVTYAPFGALLPGTCAFVHHGGIGSTAHALRAGVPQLIRPMAYDQFDNSAKSVHLGTAVEILDKDYTPDNVASALQKLISDRSIRANCADWAEQLNGTTGIADACDFMLHRLASLSDA